MDDVIANVKGLLDEYGYKINSTEQLALLYWQKIDGCSVSKESISTPDFLYKATRMEEIMAAQRMLRCKK